MRCTVVSRQDDPGAGDDGCRPAMQKDASRLYDIRRRPISELASPAVHPPRPLRQRLLPDPEGAVVEVGTQVTIQAREPANSDRRPVFARKPISASSAVMAPCLKSEKSRHAKSLRLVAVQMSRPHDFFRASCPKRLWRRNAYRGSERLSHRPQRAQHPENSFHRDQVLSQSRSLLT